MEHNTPEISTRPTARAACLLTLVLVSACRFSTAPSETLGEDAAESQVDVAGSAANGGDAGARPTSASTRMIAAAEGDKNPAQGADSAAQSGGSAPQGSNSAGQGGAPAAPGSSAAAGSGSAASTNPPASTSTNAPITAHAPPPTANKHAASSGAPTTANDLDAGSQPSPDGTKSPSDTECSNALAGCLLENPLNYAECLRKNADRGCPDPDAGTSTTSTVTTEDGKPLSQACQAELANCIARNPTPENANACTEKARKCK